jgi:hypothetical protein
VSSSLLIRTQIQLPYDLINLNYFLQGSALVWILNGPQRPCGKSSVPSLVLLGGGVTFKKWDLVESLGSLGCSFEEDSGTPPLPLALFLLPRYKRSNFGQPCSPCHDMLPCHRPKSNGTNWPLTETSKTMNQNNPFSFYKIILGICFSTKKPTSTGWMSKYSHLRGRASTWQLYRAQLRPCPPAGLAEGIRRPLWKFIVPCFLIQMLVTQVCVVGENLWYS